MSMSQARLLIANYRAAIAHLVTPEGDINNWQEYDSIKADFGADALELLETMVEP